MIEPTATAASLNVLDFPQRHRDTPYEDLPTGLKRKLERLASAPAEVQEE
jgi:hypothetical protein